LEEAVRRAEAAEAELGKSRADAADEISRLIAHYEEMAAADEEDLRKAADADLRAQRSALEAQVRA
jgi:hypothetical protein